MKDREEEFGRPPWPATTTTKQESTFVGNHNNKNDDDGGSTRSPLHRCRTNRRCRGRQPPTTRHRHSSARVIISRRSTTTTTTNMFLFSLLSAFFALSSSSSSRTVSVAQAFAPSSSSPFWVSTSSSSSLDVGSTTRRIRRADVARRLQGSSSGGGGSVDEFDMDELKRRIADEINPFRGVFAQQAAAAVRASSSAPTTTAASNNNNHNNNKILHIIAFANNAGVHSIEYPKGSGCNTVLAFENEMACAEFASRLRAQHFFDPEPQSILMDTLHSFCDKMGVHLQIVPDGVNILPPSQNVKLVGRHNRRLREQQNHLEYIFNMMDDDDDDLTDYDHDDEGLAEGAAAAFQ